MNDTFSSVLFFISCALLVVVLCKVIVFLSLSSRHHDNLRRAHPKELGDKRPLVSVLVPSYNEELTLTNCITSLLKQNYSNIEIIIINDGSTDDTLLVAVRLSKEYEKVRVLHKVNGGKASALNYGIRESIGEIVVCMDADSMFLPNTIEQLVLSFQDPTVAAVGGNVKIVNRNKALGKFQAIEYITGLTIQRRAFAHIGCMQVISGAIGAFRRNILIRIDGYSRDTIVEDMDITIELSRRTYKIAYNPYAIAYTEGPETISDFMKQRYRWTYGGFQVIAKHWDVIFKRRLNKMGMVGVPYFLIFPWVDVLVSLLLIVTVIKVALTGDGFSLLLFYLLMSTLQAILMMYALIVDKERKRLVFLAGLDSLFYSHVINFVTVKAGIGYLFKRKTSWNKLRRYGKNSLLEAVNQS